MDGYAIRAADTAAATEERPVVLRVVGEVAGGISPERVEPGTAVRIATGAPLPAGADAVVPVEQTTPLDASGAAAGPSGREATGPLPAAVPCMWSCPRADPCAGGATTCGPRRPCWPPARGSRRRPSRWPQGPARASSPSTGGRAWPCWQRATRSASRGRRSAPAGIPDANGPGLRALVARCRGDPGRARHGRRTSSTDVRRAACAGHCRASTRSSSAAASRSGPYDVVKAAFDEVGEVDLWRVAVQPGKPFAFGTRRRGRTGAEPALRPARQPGLDRSSRSSCSCGRPSDASPGGAASSGRSIEPC